jgi:hypothetical protein
VPGFGGEEEHLSKRKKGGPREERRRQAVEINLLVEKDDQKAVAKVRRGCTLPFLSAGLLLLTFEAVRAVLL